MTEQPAFYPASQLRDRARLCEDAAEKSIGFSEGTKNTLLMEAWALRVAADIVAASERACRAGFVQLGFTGDLSQEDMQEAMALNIAAMRLELAAREQGQS